MYARMHVSFSMRAEMCVHVCASTSNVLTALLKCRELSFVISARTALSASCVPVLPAQADVHAMLLLQALALECLRGAHRQRRACYLYAFSGPSEQGVLVQATASKLRLRPICPSLDPSCFEHSSYWTVVIIAGANEAMHAGDACLLSIFLMGHLACMLHGGCINTVVNATAAAWQQQQALVSPDGSTSAYCS